MKGRSKFTEGIETLRQCMPQTCHYRTYELLQLCQSVDFKKVDSRSTLRRGTIRYAMERGSPGTTLWFVMDSLSAIRYALERRIPRTTLCGTWKLEHYVIHFVFLFMIVDHSLL